MKKMNLSGAICLMAAAMMLGGCSSGTAQQPTTQAVKEETTKAEETTKVEETVKAEESSSEAESSQEKNADSGKHYVIGVSQPTMTHPIRKAGNEIIDAWKEKHPNVEVIVSDGQLKADKQIADIEDMIAKKVDAILVAAHQSPTLVPVLQQAKDAGIPIVAFDRELTDKSVEVCEVINDDITAGKTGVELLVEGMGEEGEIAILEGVSGSAVTVNRQKGFMEEIEKYPNIKIVADQNANFQRVQAVDLFENVLQANPNIKGVFCHNDEMALGVVKVLKDAGIEGVTVVGIDGQKDALEAILAGDMHGTVRKIVELEYALDEALSYLDTGSCKESIMLESMKIDSTNVEEVYDPDAVF